MKNNISTNSQILNTNYKNLVQFKHACLDDYVHRDESPRLSGCNCPYYKKYAFPCWHMYQVAIKSGIFTDSFERGKFLLPAINSLSDSAFRQFGTSLYGGYYDNKHPLSELGRYQGVIAKSGLIIINNNDKTFLYSKDVQENIFFVLYTFFTAKRYK